MDIGLNLLTDGVSKLTAVASVCSVPETSPEGLVLHNCETPSLSPLWDPAPTANLRGY